jgi:D-glycero-D-manno-heptose 1,7-bisphosphate phosphatase
VSVESPERMAVFLDRDGVLNVPLLKNGKPYPPATIQEFRLMPGVKEAICAFVKAKFLLIVITNQPDPARGTQKREVVEEMHALLKKWLPLDDILTAWDETSAEYKPSIGLVKKAVEKYHINLTKSFFTCRMFYCFY